MQEENRVVFISYSRQDLDIARAINMELNEAGITTFFDISDHSGSDGYQDMIAGAIMSSQLLVFLCTPHSIQSSWAKNEVSYAISIGKTVVPVIVDDTELSIDLRFSLDRFNHLDVHTATLASDIRRVTERIKRSLESCVVSNGVIDTDEQSLWGEPREEEVTEREPINRVIERHKPSVVSCVKPDGEIDTYEQSVWESPQEEKVAKRKSVGWKILSILLCVVIAFVVIYYVFGVFFLFQSGEAQRGIALLSPLAIGIIVLVLLIARSRKYELKLYCCSDDGSAATLRVTVDDRVVSTIEGKGMVRLREKRGEYLISIDSDDPKIEGETFIHSFCRKNSGDVMQVTLKARSYAVSELKKQASSEITEFRCFIAGSTRLFNERNATRAVLSVLYNKWESHNLVISSYTFEDFSNSYQTGGQQAQYNAFIRDKANCAIFIVTEDIGDRTLEEYRLAVNTFNENHVRPKIFVYAHNLSDSDTTKQFIDEVRKNNSYWREYDDIQLLMNLIKDDIDSELFNIFIFKRSS